jgi:uncharacterized membrane-anchored protein YhcB (DUF1043 family)
MTLTLILFALVAGAAIGAHFARKHGYEQGHRDRRIKLELEVDHLKGELFDTQQRLNAAVHAVTALPDGRAA